MSDHLLSAYLLPLPHSSERVNLAIYASKVSGFSGEERN